MTYHVRETPEALDDHRLPESSVQSQQVRGTMPNPSPSPAKPAAFERASSRFLEPHKPWLNKVRAETGASAWSLG